MKRGTKIGLGIGCGGLLLAAVVIVVGGYFALNWAEKNIGEAFKKHETEGRELGRTTDQQGCMNEGFRLSKTIGPLDFNGALGLSTYVDACLEASRETPNFCEGVPSFWSMKETEWGAAQCRKAGLDPEKTGCVHVTKRKHQFCSKPL